MHNKQNNLKKWAVTAAIAVGGPVMMAAPVLPISEDMQSAYLSSCDGTREYIERHKELEADIYMPENCVGDYAVAIFVYEGGKKYVDIPVAKYHSLGVYDGVKQNPTYTEYKSVLDILTPKADAAIAFDASVDVQASGSCNSQTFAFDPVSSTDNVILVGAFNGEFSISGVTYAGNSLTLIDQYAIQAAEYLSLWYKTGVGNTSQNVVVTYAGTSGCRSQAVSYTGVKQTDTFAQTNKNTDTTFDDTTGFLTTATGVQADSWIVSVQRNNIGNFADGVNFKIRGTGTSFQLGDSNTVATSTWGYVIGVGLNGGYISSLWAELCEAAGCAGAAVAPPSPTDIIIFE